MGDLFKKTVITAGITAIVYVILFSFFDRPIDLWFHHNYSDTWLFRLGTCISYLANGGYVRLGLAACFILLLMHDSRGTPRGWTRGLLYICLSGAIAITIGDGLKYLLGRYRPIMLFEHNLYGLHFFSSQWALNSTPSGHTIRAFSLLTAASLLHRRFTVVFLSIASIIGASRVAVTAHYPSDVLFGAFIGIFTAVWTYRYFYEGNKFGKNDFNSKPFEINLPPWHP